jgi:predicted MFS family arabinose efflux permease
MAQSGTAIVSMRFMTFLMYFGAFMPTSFVPLVMSTFPKDFFGMSPMQAAAVPLSVEMLCGAVMLMVAGRLIRTTGWLPLALAGVAMAGAGMVLCAFATDPLTFVLARGLVGLGTMAGLTGINGLIDRIRSLDGHAAPDPQMFAGMYAGVNCGAVVGALLAGRVGYGPVFMAAGAVLLLVVVHVWLAVPSAVRGRPPAMAPSTGGGGRWLALAGYLLLISIPTSACSMFLPFLFPLLASEAGASSSTIGRAFLLNGLCIVFLGPLLWKFIRNRMPPWLAVLLSGLLTASALIAFGIQSGLPMAFLAVFLIGVADSFGLVSQQRCVEVLAGPSHHDRASARAWHLNARKVGQMLGPMLFSAVAGLQLAELKLGGIDLPGFMAGFSLASAGVGLIGTGLAVMLLVFGVAALLAPRRAGMTVLAGNDAR